MSQPKVYAWEGEIRNHLPLLGERNLRALAYFTQGVMVSGGCQGHKVARYLNTGEVELASIERRWERFLANERVEVEAQFADWTRWVLEEHHAATVYLLVDETKLGAHLGAMVVGLAYQQRCIPLAWHLYRANCAAAYPAEGQVGMIMRLLHAIAPGIQAGVKVVVLADRGIGTSAALARQVAAMGWCFLFRVVAHTKVVTRAGAEFALAAQARPGEVWSCEGLVFKNGKVPGQAIVLQSEDALTPWALVTNDLEVTGWEYGYRNWQEQAFRDLKQHGWHWEQSRVRDPAHAMRLWLILVLAYARTLAWGVAQSLTGNPARLRFARRQPPRRRWSLFQQGLDAFLAWLARPFGNPFQLAFPP